MIDYSLEICYGFVIDDTILDKIEKFYDYNDDIEDFVDRYVRCIDSWKGDKYFIGLSNKLFDDTENIYYFEETIDEFPLSEINNFYDIVTNLKIKEIAGNDLGLCRKMLINFVY